MCMYRTNMRPIKQEDFINDTHSLAKQREKKSYHSFPIPETEPEMK